MDLQTAAVLMSLKRRAREHGLNIVRNYGTGYILVDTFRNAVACYPSILTLEEVEQWLDELDERAANNG